MASQSDIMLVTKQALQEITDPVITKHIEEVSAANQALAKEQGDFEKVVDWGHLYLLARRRTTELIKPTIEHGGDRGKNQYSEWQGINIDTLPLTLADYGFTKLQWGRRTKELDITIDAIDGYIDFCIETNSEPTKFGLLKYAYQIIADSTGNEWWTPESYIDSVRKVLGEIDLDPASCEEANVVIGAKKIYTELDSGLQYPWHGRVFMNPPYSSNKEFAEKMHQEYTAGNVTEAIVLLGAHAIETKWFAEYWDHVLCFTGHRIKFNTPTGAAIAGNIAGSVFIHLGQDSHIFAKEFIKHGYVVKRWPE